MLAISHHIVTQTDKQKHFPENPENGKVQAIQMNQIDRPTKAFARKSREEKFKRAKGNESWNVTHKFTIMIGLLPVLSVA